MRSEASVRDVQPQPTLARLAVGAQIALLVALAWPGRRRGPEVVAWTGRAVTATGALVGGAAAAGMGSALTPSPVPRPGARLRKDGFFGRVRHPIYSGLLLFAAGRALTAGGWRVLPAAALGVLLQVKARWEEQLLSERFADYPSYAATTARFIPALRTGRR